MRIRALETSDVAFLREMLYVAAFWRGPEGAPPMDEALEHPQLVIFHEGWGRHGDVGFVADGDTGPIGAVWYRFFTAEAHGYGFVDERTPEVAIAVVDGERGSGVGRALLEAIAEHARDAGVPRLSLSVDAENRAKHLYESVGYVEYEPGDGRGRMLLEIT